MEQRIEYLISLYQKLKPEEEITRYTKIKNATIESICVYDGGAYNRVRIWLEGAVGKRLGEQSKQEQDIEGDMKLAMKEFQSCFALMQQRNKKYGDSWKKLRLESIVDLMIMKLDRCQKQQLDEKALEVELEDLVNYGIFGLINIRNK